MDPLTLGRREAINPGRTLRSQDRPREPWYCWGCLADLPWNPEGQAAHRCGEPPLDVPSRVVHETRTYEPRTVLTRHDGTSRTDRRGQRKRERGAWALCTCGWKAWGDSRPLARAKARGHRDETAKAA
jgi:hypothetical protein